jgi:hypothetical protein
MRADAGRTERNWGRHNLRQAITRLEQRLLNSMAHVHRPRPADEARWATWRQEIAAKTALLADIERRELKRRQGGSNHA